MFDFIRTHQRLMLLVLVILIFPSFALVGISGYTNYVSANKELVRIGDSAITQEDFDNAQRNQLQQLQARMGSAFDPAVLNSPQMRENLLESLVDRAVIVEAATKDHFSVSDNVLRRAIASIPELQVDGQFSPERYNEVLASMGMTSRDFEQGQRAELALQRVLAPVGLTAALPVPVTDAVQQALTAERTIRLKTYAAQDYADKVTVTDEDIKTWYDQNQAALQVPEHISAQYLVLDETAAMNGLPEISEADLQAYYQQNKSRYVLPGRVFLNHILVNAPQGASQADRSAARARAQTLADTLKDNPAGFAELAKAESQDIGSAKDGGRLGWVSRGSLPAQLESAIFALVPNQVSGVVEGPDGYHIFLATEVEAERGETFEQARAKVQAEVRRQMGSERFADLASRLRDLAYDNATSLEPAAQGLGLEIRKANGIAQDRLLPEQQVQGAAAAASADAAILDDIRVRRALFSPALMAEKQNSGVIEISPDTLVVVRVDQVVPARVQPLDQVSGFIRTALTNERATKAAQEAAQADMKTWQANAGVVPAGFGDAMTVSRINPQGVETQALEAAFRASADALPAYEGVGGQGAMWSFGSRQPRRVLPTTRCS
ncbi:SurA N-terminal domain-containing protein [Neopusillimonas aromaticivorans]|uniref:SurA N-terminal domain-containing protein n=1 Tax=Neopusillimonas aromaticivorans TaxID=2979868 RepID=UPI00259624D7|nr:SurA N-terminal domain-containing protein [Neopusillimonas aromaticivorans]WJJ93699.1 SurA N-terminal domain-containing protein [Neopusillimonas aromaticivorans]